MGDGDTLDDVEDGALLVALGRLTLAMLAAQRNQIREDLLDGGHDPYENPITAPEDFLGRRADRRERVES